MNKNRWRSREMLIMGQVLKIYGASVKTLYHYEKIGLLKSRKTGEANGYRHYEDSQTSIMLLIERLKRYGFSPTGIQGLLNTKGAGGLLGQLRKQKFRLEQQMNYLSVTVRGMGIHLEGFRRTGDIVSYQNNYGIRVKETEEQVLVTDKQNMSVEEFGNYYGELYEKIAKEHLTANGIIMTTYHDREFDPAYSDIEFIVGITGRDKADCIMLKRSCAATAHKGAYSELPDVYGVTVSWASANKYRPDGMPYEVYVKNHFHNLSSEEWETETLFLTKR